MEKSFNLAFLLRQARALPGALVLCVLCSSLIHISPLLAAENQTAGSKTDARLDGAGGGSANLAKSNNIGTGKNVGNDDLCIRAASVPSLQKRMAHDPRIRVQSETFLGEERVHVYLFTSEQALPYAISLGWFSVRDQKDSSADGLMKKRAARQGPAVIDELGLILPLPGESPQQKDYDKAAWRADNGFDHVSDNNLSAAEKDFLEALKFAPTNARLNNNLAAVLALRGDYAEASSRLEKAIQENKKFALAYANRALVSLAIGQPSIALDDAAQAVNLQPHLIPARVAYARALLECGKPKEALELAQELKKESPDEWQCVLLLNDALIASKEYKQAKAHLERLLVLSPGNTQILLKIAYCSEKLGDLDEAIKRARQAVQIAPDDARSHIVLAKYLENNRDEKAALLQYERAMDLQPERSLRKTAMGAILRLLIGDRHKDRADDFSRRWVKQFAEDAECHFNRAWIASQLGDDHMQETIDEYKKALELQPKLASARYNLALALIKAGEKAQALKQLHTFVDSAPGDSDCQSAKELIRKLEDNG